MKEQNGPLEHPEQGTDAKIAKKAKEFLTLAGSYQGSQLTYMMEDLVALSLGRLDEPSKNGDLRSILQQHYSGWTEADFKKLLETLSTNDHLKDSIENARMFLAED